MLARALRGFPALRRVVYSTCSALLIENQLVVLGALLRAANVMGDPTQVEMVFEKGAAHDRATGRIISVERCVKWWESYHEDQFAGLATPGLIKPAQWWFDCARAAPFRHRCRGFFLCLLSVTDAEGERVAGSVAGNV